MTRVQSMSVMHLWFDVIQWQDNLESNDTSRSGQFQSVLKEFNLASMYFPGSHMYPHIYPYALKHGAMTILSIKTVEVISIDQ